jgi:hypothetical protein
MAELIDICVHLVGNPLAVAVDVDAAEARGFDAVLAQVPDIVKHRVGRREPGRIIIERVMHGDLPDQ